MLLSLRDRIQVYLHPQQVILLRMTRGWKRKITARQVVTCEAVPGEANWSGALAALSTVLKGADWQNAQVTVVLSNHFVHFAYGTWNDQIAGREEREAFIRYRFEEAYGDVAQGWALRASDGGPDGHWLASGIERDLIQAVQDVFKGTTLRPDSLQPYLMAALNYWRSSIASGDACFVLVEAGRLCIAVMRDGVWLGVRGRTVAAGWQQELSSLLEREMLLSGVSATDIPIYLCWPENPGWVPVLPENWKMNVLESPASEGLASMKDAAYTPAMLG